MAASRKISVQIVGDSRSFERAIQRSAKAAQKFGQQVDGISSQTKAVKRLTAAEEDLIKVRSRRASSLGPFRLAGVGLGAGLGLYAATQAARELGDRLEVVGQEAFTTQGKLRNMAAALTSGNLVGAVDALTRVPKTLEELGVTAFTGADRFKALQQVASGATAALHDNRLAAKLTFEELKRLRKIEEEAGTEDRKLAGSAGYLKQALTMTRVATEGLADSTARMGATFRTATGDLLTFKGAADDVAGMRGPGARLDETPYKRPGMQTLKPLSPSQRRELSLIGQEGMQRIPELQDRLKQLNGQMTKFHGNQEQRLKILTNIKETEAQIAAIYKDQAAKRKAASEAAAAAAEAARQKRIATKTGWLDFGIEQADATKGVKDDVAAWREMERYLKERIRQEGRTLELARDLWRARQRIKDLGKGQDRDPLAGLMQASTKQITNLLAAGTGLRGAGRAALGANISGLQMRPIYINNTVELDGAVVARNTTTHQKRGGQRTGAQTSGRR